MDEVGKAIEMSYSSVDVFEFWDYSLTRFDNDTNSGGHYAQHVNMFLKLKQESSGNSSRIQSKIKDKYMED